MWLCLVYMTFVGVCGAQFIGNGPTLVHMALWGLSGAQMLLDNRAPLVYEDPQEPNPKNRPSYFGYSVLLYSRNSYTWLQVGAPRGKLPSPSASETGSVYRCGITGICNPVMLERAGDQKTSEYSEKKEGSWLGASMAVHPTADKIVVCAPRWIDKFKRKDWLMPGACYTTQASNTNLLAADAEKLIPLLNKDYTTYTEPSWGMFVFDWGLGQAGISAYFVQGKDDAEPENVQLVLGSPGVYNWRGANILYTERTFGNVINKRDIFGAVASFDAGIVTNLRTSKGSHDVDYRGYSGTAGYFFSKSKLLHVTASPRGHGYTGMVEIYDFRSSTRQAPLIKQVLVGPAVGCYFGAALAAGDLTGDGLDDLIVGAPYGKQPTVHIYLGSKRGSLIDPPSGANRLIIPQWGELSRFGISLATSDINLDGFHDIVIGAPEAPGGGGIAIFLGGPNGLKETPKQMLLAEDIAPGLGIRGFGISIAPPVDIDQNSFPDVAVGAYVSGHAIVLRTRARAELAVSINNPGRLFHESRFLSLEFCLHYICKHPASKTVNVSRVFSVDTIFRRAYMNGTLPHHNPVYTNGRTLVAGEPQCQRVDIIMKRDITNFIDPLEIILNVTIQEGFVPHNVVRITRDGVKGQDKFDQLTPVIEGDKSTARLNLPFSTNCGDDNICTSDLIVNAHFPHLQNNEFVLGSNDSIEMEITLENYGEPAYLAQVMVNLMNPASLARLSAICRADPDIICNMDNPLQPNTKKKITLEIDMREVSEMSRSGEKLEFIVTALTKSDLVKSEKNVHIVELSLKVDASIAIVGKSDQDIYTYTLSKNIPSTEPVIFKQMIEVQKFGASPIDEVKLTITLPYKYIHEDEEITFVQIYQPEGFQSGQPFSCIAKDNLTYAVMEVIDTNRQSQHEGEMIEDETNSTERIRKRSLNNEYEQEYFKLVVNKESDLLDDEIESRKIVKRSLKDTKIPEERRRSLKLPANRTTSLSCADSNIICHEMECSLGPFRSLQHEAKLVITMSLNISALKVKVMRRKDILMLSSFGTAVILGPDGERGGTVGRIKSIFLSTSPAAQVELWVLAVSVILGIILLLIVIVGLVKAGFFQRKKKDQLEALKQAEEEQEKNTEADVWTEENQKEEEEEFKVDER